jgi:single-strand DNA-binding protein
MNNITVAGPLGRDAELRATPKGDHVASFSVADSQGKDKPPIWWRCQLWGKRAETLTQYLAKGQSVTVTGQVSINEYKDKDGTPKQSYEIRVNDVALQGRPQGETGQAPARQPAKPAPKPQGGGSGFDDMDDDIPF